MTSLGLSIQKPHSVMLTVVDLWVSYHPLQEASLVRAGQCIHLCIT